MNPQYPVVNMESQQMDIPGNDSKHNKTNMGHGGGPTTRTKMIPIARRGGVGHSGQRTQGMPSGRTHPTAGNPASRGGTPVAFHPDKKIAGHGGSPQMSSKMGVGQRGGFGHSGQKGVPGVRSNPKPGRGNVGGTSHKLIAAHLRWPRIKGAGAKGSWGGPPVNVNT